MKQACTTVDHSPATSTVELDVDDLDSDDDSVESSSKRMKTSKGTTLFIVQSVYMVTLMDHYR